MTTPGTEPDRAWGQLATAPTGERETQVLARYQEVATLPEDERRTRLRSMAQAEYALSDEQLRTMTLARMRAFLQMEPEHVRTIIASLDAVMDQLPGAAAMRRVALVQTLAREFSVEDQQRMRELAPSLFGERPAVTPEPAASAPAPSAPARKPWWAFWRKD